MLGKDRGDMAVWPHAEHADVEYDLAQLSGVRLGCLIEIEAPIACSHLMNSVRVQRKWRCKQVESLLRVPVGMLSGDKPFVAPPQLDPRPVDSRVRPFVGGLLIGPSGDPTTGERKLGNSEVPLNLSEPRHQARG